MTTAKSESAAHRYRPDIDGLRAIAVMAVVLYHANTPGFSGGFLGVDIFFVLSGYLITQILIRSDGTLGRDILRFYERRVRRIVPALAVVLTVCTIAAFILLSPFELRAFSITLFTTTGFASNLYFMRALDYFTPKLEMPLLHLWSLGVEEQFYIAYPLFLWLMMRRARRLLLPTLVTVFVLSLALSEYLAEYHTRDAFFFTGSRAWELMLGAIVALIPWRCTWSKPIVEAVTVIALLAVIAPIGVFDQKTLWPGLHALLPCAGTALLLNLHQSRHSLAKRVLSAPPLVGLGLISYSLYLWHWPLFAFYRRAILRIPTPVEYTVLIIIALCAAWLSWRYVERPFRRDHSGINRAFVFRGAGVCATLMLSVCAAIYFGNSFPQRFSPAVTHVYSYMNSIEDPIFMSQMGSCFVLAKEKGAFPFEKCFRLSTQEPNVVLWGDSFARNYIAGFREQAQKNKINMIQANFAACLPLSGSERQLPSCNNFNRALTMRLDHTIKAVIISGRYYNNPDQLPALLATARLIARKGIRVIVLGPSIEYTEAEPFYVARFLETRDWQWLNSRDFLKPNLYQFDRKMQTQFAGEKGITYISVLQNICRDGHCPMFVGNAPAQFDFGHMTLEGSRAFGAILWPQVYAAITATEAPQGSLVK